ncbi:MAG: acyl-CoA reductase [Bacteroidia bacterium]|nr:acyl-CoA reductase [Bacteroidia bacterium]
MNLEQRISSFSSLGKMLRSFTGLPKDVTDAWQVRHEIPGHIQVAMEKTERENPWFTRINILRALRYWGAVLDKPILEKWLKSYHPKINDERNPRRVGVIMAGNIPMVGFHDLLCVLLSGNHLLARLSSQDTWLIPAIVQYLVELEPAWSNQIEFTTEGIEKPEAIIATGSNNTSRYFSYYFGKYPHIIRKNRSGVAILDGNETAAELEGIASDIFSYFGLGCRSVSKLYLPEGYDLKPLHEAFLQYKDLFHHSKYRNNLDYYKSICLVNRTRFLDGVFYLLIEDEPLATPVSVLHYEYYRDFSLIQTRLDRDQEQIQCIVARKDLLPGVVEPGETQQPALSDYADGVDTLIFLLEKI